MDGTHSQIPSDGYREIPRTLLPEQGSNSVLFEHFPGHHGKILHRFPADANVCTELKSSFGKLKHIVRPMMRVILFCCYSSCA